MPRDVRHLCRNRFARKSLVKLLDYFQAVLKKSYILQLALHGERHCVRYDISSQTSFFELSYPLFVIVSQCAVYKPRAESPYEFFTVGIDFFCYLNSVGDIFFEILVYHSLSEIGISQIQMSFGNYVNGFCHNFSLLLLTS